MPKSSTAPHTEEPRATGRARRPPLTRARIVDTALKLMDEEGLEAVTMRRIGRELGVEAMSLYNHVGDKEDILTGIVEAVMAEFDFPGGEGERWTERARDTARAWRRLLLAHPNVITLMSEQRKPMTSIQAMRPTDHAIGILRASGLPDDDAAAAFRAFGGFIQGFVLMEVANMFGGDEIAVRPEDVAGTLPVAELPNLAAALSHLYACDFDEAFEYGLDLMIRGVEAKVAGMATG